MDLQQLSIAALLALVAYIVKGFTGFGAGIVVVPLLSLFLDLKVVVFAACVCAGTNGIVLARTEWRNAAWRAIVWIGVAALAVLGFGTYALVSLKTEALRKSFGALVCVFALVMLLEKSSDEGPPPKPWPEWLAPVSGFVGGALLGLFGAGGPAMVIYLTRRLPSKVVLRASIIMLFLCIDAARLGAYLTAGMLTHESARLACWTLPAALLGSSAGTKAQNRVNRQVFRRIVAAVLFATGLLLAGR